MKGTLEYDYDAGRRVLKKSPTRKGLMDNQASSTTSNPTNRDLMIIAIIPMLIGVACSIGICYAEGGQGIKLVFVALISSIFHWGFWVTLLTGAVAKLNENNLP